MAEPDSCSSARGRADAKAHVRGINFPWEGCNWASTLSSPGRHLGFQYTYDETVVDRQKVTNLRLPGQYDERLLSSLGLQGPYYNWNRWYLPGVGRYLELDPVAAAGKFNVKYGVEWYGYAGANPILRVDPLGLAMCTYHVISHTMFCGPNDGGPGTYWYDDHFRSGNNNVWGCKDNPLCDFISDVGPTPEGLYIIRPKFWDGTKYRRPLDPLYSTLRPNTWHRFALQMHSCQNLNATNCSTGCVTTTVENWATLNEMFDADPVNLLWVEAL